MNRTALLPLAALALASCGGGSGGDTVPVISSVPTPTPSPTPTAAPYSTYAQLTGDQTFKTACAALRDDFSPPLPAPATPFGSGLTLSYASTTQTYTLTPAANDTGLFGTLARSYGPSDRDASAPLGVIAYARTVNGFQERLSIGSNSANGSSPDYVRGFSARVPLYGAATSNPPAAQYSCVFGVPTRIDDLPAVSPAYTRTGLNGFATGYPPGGAPQSYVITQSQVNVTVDLAGRRLTATVHLVGALTTASGTSATTSDLGTYTGTAAIDPSGSYSGQLSSPDRSIQDASFAGWFFGPQAGEAAFSIGLDSLDQNSGQRIVFLGNALALR